MTDKEKIRAEIERRLKALQGSVTDYARGERKELEKLLSFIDSLQEEPVSEDLFEASAEYATTGEILANGKEMIDFQKQKAFIAGAEWKFERVKEALLSEVLPCFMHGGEADEVVAKLDEVLNQKR